MYFSWQCIVGGANRYETTVKSIFPAEAGAEAGSEIRRMVNEGWARDEIVKFNVTRADAGLEARVETKSGGTFQVWLTTSETMEKIHDEAMTSEFCQAVIRHLRLPQE